MPGSEDIKEKAEGYSITQVRTIVHLSAQLPWRGGEQQLVYLVEELNKEEDLEQVIICARGSALADYCKKNELDYIEVTKRSAFDLIFAREIVRVCKRFEPELIHIHDPHAHTFAIIAATMYKNKVPLVLSRKVDFPIRNSRFSKFKYNHSRIKKIICVSGAIKEIMARDIKNTRLLTVVHDGVDPSRFLGKQPSGYLRKKYKVREDELLIGNVAAIAPHKDYFTFVDTVELLVAKGVKAMFFIIGDGPEKEEIQAYIACKKLNANIVMTGFLDSITEILPELDVLMFTSKTEGLGTTILDAYASGVNVVATKAGGVPEIVDHEATGLLANVQDPEDISKQVIRLIEDENLKTELRRNALEKLKEFTKERMASATLKVYDEVSS